MYRQYFCYFLLELYLPNASIVATYCIMAIMFPSSDGVIDADPADGMVVPF